MSKEIIAPKSIREVSVKGTYKYQHYVGFFARSNGKFWRYTDPDPDSNTVLKGPSYDQSSDSFIQNGNGNWKPIEPGCFGIIQYYLSPKIKVETPRTHGRRMENEEAFYESAKY